eukprot:1159853-Pelagomonas_calceolata.AAC.1
MDSRPTNWSQRLTGVLSAALLLSCFALALALQLLLHHEAEQHLLLKNIPNGSITGQQGKRGVAAVKQPNAERAAMSADQPVPPFQQLWQRRPVIPKARKRPSDGFESPQKRLFKTSCV